MRVAKIPPTSPRRRHGTHWPEPTRQQRGTSLRPTRRLQRSPPTRPALLLTSTRWSRSRRSPTAAAGAPTDAATPDPAIDPDADLPPSALEHLANEDSPPCYRSKHFAEALKDTRTSPRRTRAYRPQTNGKVERFNRILNEEWAYFKDWTSDTQRSDAHQAFMHYYNEHRPHGSLSWDTPMATLTRLSGDNVLGMHS